MSSYNVTLAVREFDGEDWDYLVEQAVDGGSGNLRIDKKGELPLVLRDVDYYHNGFIVTILDDDGEEDDRSFASYKELIDTIVFYAACEGYFFNWDSTDTELVVDFSQFGIFDASSVFQMAAFGEVIVS